MPATRRRPGRRGAAVPVAAVALVLLPACGSAGSSTPMSVTLGLVAPVTADPYVVGTLRRGVDLAVAQINAKGGLAIGGVKLRVVVRTYDDGLDPQRTRAAVQSAIHDGVSGIVTDGYGVAAAAPDSAAAHVPVVVVNNGQAALMDPKARPSLFRLGVPNDAAASVLSAYVAKSSKAPAIIHDDSDDGRDGAAQMAQALPTAGASAVSNTEIPAGAPAVDAEIRAALEAHADSLVVWGTDTFVAHIVQAARTASPHFAVFTGPSGESPALRAVAGADASDGVVFTSSRMTSEDDSASFGQFEHAIAASAGGPTDAGIKDREGREIRQPADLEIFSYDAVNLVAAALEKAGSARPSGKLVSAMTQVRVHSANGDTRGFNPDNHEGVADDDLYISRIDDMVFAPVRDEKLSATLPTADQILADFH